MNETNKNKESLSTRLAKKVTSTIRTIQVIFILMKATEQIDWSWVEVFVPIYLYVGIILASVFLVGVFTVVDEVKN